ncbi:MAG: serine/threonine protein kinase, partial [Myxococcales bacterium]|nr:serine/threonine protein kinase [Myxococcales bacterium]
MEPEPPAAATGDAPTERLDAGVGSSSTLTFAIGDEVAGRYRIEAFLGQGGMGEVYRARDLELDVTVALKTVRGAAGPDDPAVTRFKREVQLARKVTHPAVCRIFDLGWHLRDPAPPVAFLTMELIEGETLAERLARGPLPPAQVLALARQIAAAIDVAHAVGVVHRDLKPGNVMIADGAAGPRAVVTDFGLARASAAAREPVVASSSS